MDWVWVVVVLDVQALCLQTRLSPVTKQAWPFQMEDKKSSKPRVKMTNTYKKGRICSAHTHYCISLYLYIYIYIDLLPNVYRVLVHFGIGYPFDSVGSTWMKRCGKWPRHENSGPHCYTDASQKNLVANSHH